MKDWRLTVVQGSDYTKTALLNENSVIIGRDTAMCNFALNDPKVSRQHARVSLTESGAVFVEDLHSTHGTYLNQQKVRGLMQVSPEDTLIVGDSHIKLSQVQKTGELQNKQKASTSLRIGRETSNDLVIEEIQVSRNHARIDCQGDGFFISDLNSTHGTYLDGEKIKGTVELKHRSWITIGDRNYYFDNSSLINEQGVIIASLGGQTGTGIRLTAIFLIPFTKVGFLKLLLGSLLSCIPVVDLFTEGYRYQAIKDSYVGKMEMPKWENWHDLFIKGVLLFLARITYLFPALLLFLILFAIDFNQAVIESGLMRLIITLAIVFLIPAALFLPMGWAHLVFTGNLSSILEFRIITLKIKNIALHYFSLMVILATLWLLLYSIALIPFFGVIVLIIGGFYLRMVAAFLYGQLYRLADL